MIGRTNVGGGGVGNAFAYIGVTYPAGSILTCTDGTKTLRAKDTTGLYVFGVPYAGTWTVTATSGSDSASERVTISTLWQDVVIALSFWDGVAYDSTGDEHTRFTGGWVARPDITGPSNNTTRGSYIVPVTHSSGIEVMVFWATPTSTSVMGSYFAQTQNKVDVTNFNHMAFTVAGGNSYPFACMLYLSNTTSGTISNVSGSSWTNFSDKDVFRELNEDISNITGSYYVTIAVRSTHYYDIQDPTRMNVSNVRFYNA